MIVDCYFIDWGTTQRRLLLPTADVLWNIVKPRCGRMSTHCINTSNAAFRGVNGSAASRPSLILGAGAVTTVNKYQPIDLVTNGIGRLWDPLILVIDLIYSCCYTVTVAIKNIFPRAYCLHGYSHADDFISFTYLQYCILK